MSDVPRPDHYMGISTAYQAQHIQFSSVLSLLERTAGILFEVPVQDIRAPRRCAARTAFARQVAMYLAHVVFGLSLTRVGAIFGRDRTTVAHGCAVVEMRRDEPRLDRALSIVEMVLHDAIVRHSSDGGYRP